MSSARVHSLRHLLAWSTLSALVALPAAAREPGADVATPSHASTTSSSLAIFRVESVRLLSASARETAFGEYVEAVRAALTEGRHEEALQLATRATEFWEELRRPWLHRSAAELELRQWGNSIGSARRARRARDDSMQPPPRPDETRAAASYREGLGLYLTQRYDEALPRLREATEMAPEWAEAWRAYAEALFVSGDARGAAPMYAKALALDPRQGTARDLAYYAEATAEMGDMDSAIAAMQEALRRYPYEPGLNANLGRMFREEGNDVEAYYYFTLELLLHGTAGRFSSQSLNATTDIMTSLPDDPNDPTRHELMQVSQGLSYLREGDAHRAAHFFEHLAGESRSATPVPQILLADAFVRMGEFEKARQHLERILAQEPDFVPALLLLSQALHELGEGEQAHLTRDKAENIFPTYWKLQTPTRGG